MEYVASARLSLVHLLDRALLIHVTASFRNLFWGESQIPGMRSFGLPCAECALRECPLHNYSAKKVDIFKYSIFLRQLVSLHPIAIFQRADNANSRHHSLFFWQ